MTAPSWVVGLIGWKPSAKNKLRWSEVPNIADVDNRESLVLAGAVLESLRATHPDVRVPRDNPGTGLEMFVEQDLRLGVAQYMPDRLWEVSRRRLVTQFKQYEHLGGMDAAVAGDPNLRVTLGRDYLIKPDVTVAIHRPGRTERPLLHAAVSCKWTIRSDRVQNIRHEFNQLIRHRRGRQPHLVTVTAEPLPTRIAAIARGTGEVDAVYHIAFEELALAVHGSENRQQREAWDEVVGQGRLVDYNQLVEQIALW